MPEPSTSDSRRPRIAVVLLALASAAVVPAAIAQATDCYVTKTADTNDGACNADCSLREAINDACLVVHVPAGTYRLTIPGRDEDLGLTGDLDLGEPEGSELRGAGAFELEASGGWSAVGCRATPSLAPWLALALSAVTTRLRRRSAEASEGR